MRRKLYHSVNNPDCRRTAKMMWKLLGKLREVDRIGKRNDAMHQLLQNTLLLDTKYRVEVLARFCTCQRGTIRKLRLFVFHLHHKCIENTPKYLRKRTVHLLLHRGSLSNQQLSFQNGFVDPVQYHCHYRGCETKLMPKAGIPTDH